MNVRANSPHARDIAYHLHPYTNAAAHEEVGPHIIAGGDGVYVIDDNGKRVTMDVKNGDRVLYAKYSGQDVPRGIFGDEDEYMILKETDILAKLA